MIDTYPSRGLLCWTYSSVCKYPPTRSTEAHFHGRYAPIPVTLPAKSCKRYYSPVACAGPVAVTDAPGTHERGEVRGRRVAVALLSTADHSWTVAVVVAVASLPSVTVSVTSNV